MNPPVLNITIPVLNRFHLTQKTILALRKTVTSIPFTVTVVDNGSETALRERLVELRTHGLIDNLFLLPCNMGISCACNIGWKAVDSPFYMKLDNDIEFIDTCWLDKLFRLWSHGHPMSTLGPALAPERLRRNPGTIESQDGILGICTENLPGGAIIIPKTVSDVLGYWSEDYGLYGAEDGDYGVRMNCAGFFQYYYDDRDFFIHHGSYGNTEYEGTGLDKSKEHRNLFRDEAGGAGLFVLNNYLYNMCIRNWNVPLRYRIKDMNGYNVVLEENPEYAQIQIALQRSKKYLDGMSNTGNKFNIYSDAVVTRLKKIWESCGQTCSMPNTEPSL